MVPLPELAIAASVRPWAHRLHRHVLDHGGGVVRARVMSHDQALTDSFQVLVIDDVCSFLTPRLVHRLNELGRTVIGVYDPDDGADAKRHLLDCGVTDVIECDAEPMEFIRMIGNRPQASVPEESHPTASRSSMRMGVVGAGGGVGTTELAVSLALALAADGEAALVDLDQAWPGVAQRLGLPLHPNLRTAVDQAVHSKDDFERALHRLGNLHVITGLPRSLTFDPYGPSEILAVVEESETIAAGPLIADLGTYSEGPAVGLFQNAGPLMLVASGSPTGLLRALEVCDRLGGVTHDLLLVVNRVVGGMRRHDEIRRELLRSLGELPVLLVDEEPKVRDAGWKGTRAPRSSLTRTASAVARTLRAPP